MFCVKLINIKSKSGKKWEVLEFFCIILSQMRNFIGTYECKIDDKGRLKVPFIADNQMEDFEDKTFVVKRSVFQPCLEVYPMKAWDKLMEKINKLNRFIKKNADFIRMFTAGVKTVELDSAGKTANLKRSYAFLLILRKIL